MDKDLIRKYKEDTGNGNAFIEVELEKDKHHPGFWLISRDAKIIQKNWNDSFPTPEYLNWLEEQLKEKMK